MRAPFQVLVIPYRLIGPALEFAVLKRQDAGIWQFVAGGGETGESPVTAAARETREEIGLSGQLMPLDSQATIPKAWFAAAAGWDPALYVIPEYCFAVDAGTDALVLSAEHTAHRWVTYEQAGSLLEWDSNRCALWELNQRLTVPVTAGR